MTKPFIAGVNVHACERLTAEACESNGATWLRIGFDKGDPFKVGISIFMSIERAERLAKAINDAEAAGVTDLPSVPAELDALKVR